MSRVVYSTAHGKMCPECVQPITKCACRAPQSARPQGTGVRIGRQTQGRKGKGVTVITGLRLSDEQLQTLMRELKARCGAGGTVKDGVIEIQGDHRDRLVDELKRRGWDPKRSGG